MMQAIEIIEHILKSIEEARSVPLSRDGALVNRQEMIQLLAQLKARLPEDILEAKAIIETKAAIIDEGHRGANEIVEKARHEQNRLVSHTEIMQEAHERAQELIQMTEIELQKMRDETNKYIDGSLANFEISLTRTLNSVIKGRDNLGRNNNPQEYR